MKEDTEVIMKFFFFFCIFIKTFYYPCTVTPKENKINRKKPTNRVWISSITKIVDVLKIKNLSNKIEMVENI